MSLNKKYDEFCNEFYIYKSNIQKQQDLFRVFLHEYKNIMDDEEYILQDRNISINCLYTLSKILEDIVEENIKMVEELYFKFETL